MAFTKQTARHEGAKGGRAKARRKLTLERVERHLGELRTPQDAERWLTRLAIWGAANMLPGTVLHGAVRAVEIWMRVKEADASFEAVEALRDDVRKLREERDRLARELELAKLGVR